MKTRLLAASMLMFGLAFAAFPASAGFIEGEITISGDFVPTGGTGLANATGIDFIGDDFEVDDATLDFAAMGIAQYQTGSISDFSFNGTQGAFNLWSIGGFTFNLTSSRLIFQNNWFLLMTGVGTVSGNGFEDTVGYWSLSANSGGNLFNFSSGTVVPEPATALLMGLGFAGLVSARRRRRQ